MITLVLVHGFLGSGADWESVVQHSRLKHSVRFLVPTLPAHGHHPEPVKEPGLAGMAHWLAEFINEKEQQQPEKQSSPKLLVGYSLGGRVLMTLASQIQGGVSRLRRPSDVLGMVVESAHPGLLTAQEKKQRERVDRQWSQRFTTETLADVLLSWYQQTVFNDLSEDQKAELIAQRRHQNPHSLAKVLLSCSLALQPDFRPLLLRPPFAMHYWFGTKDQKYAGIAHVLAHSMGLKPPLTAESGLEMSREQAMQITMASDIEKQELQSMQVGGHALRVTEFRGVGHNCHSTDPPEYARQLLAVLSELTF